MQDEEANERAIADFLHSHSELQRLANDPTSKKCFRNTKSALRNLARRTIHAAQWETASKQLTAEEVYRRLQDMKASRLPEILDKVRQASEKVQIPDDALIDVQDLLEDKQGDGVDVNLDADLA